MFILINICQYGNSQHGMLNNLDDALHRPNSTLHGLNSSPHGPNSAFHGLNSTLPTIDTSLYDTDSLVQESTIEDSSESVRTNDVNNSYQIGSSLFLIIQNINSKINLRTLLEMYNTRLYKIKWRNKNELKSLEYRKETIDSILEAIHNNDIPQLCKCFDLEFSQNLGINTHMCEQVAIMYELDIINFFLGLYLYGNGLFMEDVRQEYQILKQLEPKFSMPKPLKIKLKFNTTEIYNLYLILQTVGLDIQEIADLYSIIYRKPQLSHKLNISVLKKFWNKLLLPILTNIINPKEIFAYFQNEKLETKPPIRPLDSSNKFNTMKNIPNKSFKNSNYIVTPQLKLDKQSEINKLLNAIYNKNQSNLQQDFYEYKDIVPLTKFVINQILKSTNPKINTDFNQKDLLYRVLFNNKKQYDATKIIFLLNNSYPNIEKLLNLGIDLQQVITMEEAKVLQDAYSTISHVKTILNEIRVSFDYTMILQDIVKVIPKYMKNILNQVNIQNNAH